MHGCYTAPAAKSCTQRALAAALCIRGKSIVVNAGSSNDEMAALILLRECGAIIDKRTDGLHIDTSQIKQQHIFVTCGESGLSLRMFTPILASLVGQCSIDGEGSLKKRNHQFMLQALQQAGAEISSTNFNLPFCISKQWHPKAMEVDGSHGSQFVSGLLFAFAAGNVTDATLLVNSAVSKPYMALTLEVMQKFGLKLPHNENYERFYFDNSLPDKLLDLPVYAVEGDWSNASFFAVGAAISGQLILKNLNINSAQADIKILEVLKMAGAKVECYVDRIVIEKNELNPFSFDATDSPDLFPPLVALAAYCKGTSYITGVNRLYNKESNRAATLQSEFGKMGIEILLQDNTMIIKGEKTKGATVNSHNDHRIAMACAIAALSCREVTIIENADATNKSYPDFFEHLNQLSH
ncbi:MAG: 3-phosphoshikimate 1-carboxyvinyltransferase [Bacteroidetes bacterium]|nr:3-phosphoshikimate 1-carboxyvinyltransferase [Bacteroidota bacterium]